MAFQSMEDRRKEYLQIGLIQLVNKLGERVNVKPEEAEFYYAKGYGHEVWLWHPKEAPYNQSNPAAEGSGRLFMDSEVDDLLAAGWSKTPVWEGMEEQKAEEKEKKGARKTR